MELTDVRDFTESTERVGLTHLMKLLEQIGERRARGDRAVPLLLSSISLLSLQVDRSISPSARESISQSILSSPY